MWFRRKTGPPRDQLFGDALGALEAAVNSGNADAQERLTSRVLELASEFGAEENSPWSALTDEACECLERADWKGAEAAYRNKLALPSIPGAMQCTAHFDLSSLFWILSRADDALYHAKLATDIARKEDCSILLIMALAREAGSNQALGQFANAMPLIAEALSLAGDDKIYGNMRAGLLAQRARNAVADDRLDEARIDLDVAFALLEPLSRNPIAGGVHGRLANCWEAAAELRSRLDDEEGATLAWEAAVAKSRYVSELPHCAGVYTQRNLAMTLRHHAAHLRRVGKDVHAEIVNAESQAILATLGLK